MHQRHYPSRRGYRAAGGDHQARSQARCQRITCIASHHQSGCDQSRCAGGPCHARASTVMLTRRRTRLLLITCGYLPSGDHNPDMAVAAGNPNRFQRKATPRSLHRPPVHGTEPQQRRRPQLRHTEWPFQRVEHDVRPRRNPDPLATTAKAHNIGLEISHYEAAGSLVTVRACYWLMSWVAGSWKVQLPSWPEPLWREGAGRHA
jgi:hypothetical protein